MKWQIYPPRSGFSCQELQFYIWTDRAHIDRWSGWSTPFPPVVPSNGHEWWCYISTVRAHIGIWSDRSTPTHYYLIVVKNDNFICVWLQLIFADEVAYLPPWYEHPVVKNGDFTILHLELILADELADLPPVVASSGHEWWFYICTVRAHNVRCSGRSTP